MQITQPIIQLVSRLWRHINEHRHKQFFLLLVLMILASFAEIISIGAVLPFIGALTAPNRVFEHPLIQPFIKLLSLTSANDILLPLTIAFCVASISAATIRLLLLWVSIRLSFAVGNDLGGTIYRRTLYQTYAVHTTRNSSEVINGIYVKASEVIFYILMPSLTLLSSSFMLIAIIMSLLYVIPSVALIAFGGFGVIYAIIIRLTRSQLKENSRLIAYESNHVVKCLQEGLGGIRDVLIDGTQEVFCENYKVADHILRRAQGNNQFISLSPRYGMETLGMLLIAILAYTLSQQRDGLATALPILAVVALGLQRLLPTLQQTYGAWSTIRGAQASLQDVLALLDQPLPDYVGKIVGKPLLFQNQLSLNNVSFRYNQRTPWVLRNINVTIKKGARVGFIGETGSGKSTLLDLIMGLLIPDEGLLEIDGQPITLVNQRSWQAHIAHVPQSIFLADSSIAENIAFGIPVDEIDAERLRQAAQQAQIADIIESWPDQYQTFVGERGVQLSGGQLQRIGIARALYKRADVIIFDESTSALDNETEQAVMQAIEALNEDVTLLIIAHRLTTIKNCTQIIELRSGRIYSQRIDESSNEPN